MWKRWTMMATLGLLLLAPASVPVSAQNVDLREAASAAMPATVRVDLNSDNVKDNWQESVLRWHQQLPDNRSWVRSTTLGRTEVNRCGVVVGEDLVVTMNVPPSQDDVKVWSDGKEVSAKVVVRDHVTGLVVVRVDADEPLTPITIDREPPVPGSAVAIAWMGKDARPFVESAMIGSAPAPLEPKRGFTQRLSSNLGDQIIGAPIVGAGGELVGLTMFSDDGVLLSLPAMNLDRLIEAAKEDSPNDLYRGRIGVALGDEGKSTITAVPADLPGEKAGLQAGDVLMSVGDFETVTQEDVLAAVAMARGGDDLKVVLRRGEETIEQSIQLDKQSLDQDLYAYNPEEVEDAPLDRQTFKLEDGKLVPLQGYENAIKSFQNIEKLMVPDREPLNLKDLKVERTELEEALRKLEAEKKEQDEVIRKLKEELEKLQK